MRIITLHNKLTRLAGLTANDRLCEIIAQLALGAMSGGDPVYNATALAEEAGELLRGMTDAIEGASRQAYKADGERLLAEEALDELQAEFDAMQRRWVRADDKLGRVREIVV